MEIMLLPGQELFTIFSGAILVFWLMILKYMSEHHSKQDYRKTRRRTKRASGK